MLKPLKIPKWKQEHITIDFVQELSRTPENHDFIWVIVNRLTKSAHFLVLHVNYTLERYVELYVQQKVQPHGIPVTITSDRDPRFTANFWQSLQTALGTKLQHSTAFHPQTNGQSEEPSIDIEGYVASILDRL